MNSLGYVNFLHSDICDLVLKLLVQFYIDKFITEIKSSRKYHYSEKRKLINKVQEIRNLVGIGLPTTCGHNIICDSKLKDISSLSSLFIMFDFAMTLGHKTVYNFFAWTFVHCTALPILIFNNGNVSISNDDADDEHCVVLFAWGNNGGSKETKENTKMKSSHNDKNKEVGGVTTSCIIQRISTM